MKILKCSNHYTKAECSGIQENARNLYFVQHKLSVVALWYQLVSMWYQLVSMWYQLVSMGYQLVSMGYQLVSMGLLLIGISAKLREPFLEICIGFRQIIHIQQLLQSSLSRLIGFLICPQLAIKGGEEFFLLKIQTEIACIGIGKCLLFFTDSGLLNQ